MRGRVRRLAARPLLRFPPLEVFAQLVLQTILSQILHARPALVRHRSTCPNPSKQPIAKILCCDNSLRHRDWLEPVANRGHEGRFGRPNALAHEGALWQEPAACRPFSHRFCRGFSLGPASCCRSSVVEHSLGKGEVDSSILSGSTSFGRALGRHHRAGDVSPERDALLEPRDLGVDAALERKRKRLLL